MLSGAKLPQNLNPPTRACFGAIKELHCRAFLSESLARLTPEMATPIPLTADDMFRVCGYRRGNTADERMFDLMQVRFGAEGRSRRELNHCPEQEEAMVVAHRMVAAISQDLEHQDHLPNGDTPINLRVGEVLMRSGVEQIHQNAVDETRVVYDSMTTADGESWLIRGFLWQALRECAATEEPQLRLRQEN